ncbi:MAG: outer membrane lipoprotein-sorting protein [Gammaproteobacteria bacterium]|nr:outer membrane lipoprotein-sorting protein [Gammaproteobacteria bacterium]
MRINAIARTGCAALVALGCMVVSHAEELTGDEIVKHCYYKYAGEDQRSRLKVTLTDEQGKRVNHEFFRFWKSYDGDVGDVTDKTVLFSEFPPHNRGINFMRWAYTQSSGKAADQWVYLPETHMVRRVSQRDPKNMDWGVNDEDLRVRGLAEDIHTYLGVKNHEGRDFYLVESTPRENDPTYSKRVSWFSKTGDWDTCLERRVDYYDKTNQVSKEQFIKWEKVDDAWVWRTVVVKKSNSQVSAVYDMTDVQVNVGVRDNIFSKRVLEKGMPNFVQASSGE